jgi:Dolichyl-phosphate-mannose-protein mannosyltransferase
MSAPEQASRTSARVAALVIAAIGLLELWLVCSVLSPRTFFANDAGVKYLQARTLSTSGWRRVSIPDPSEGLGLGERFSPIAGSQFLRREPGAPRYGVYSELFSLPVSGALALFGVRGLYVVPALASLATMLLAYRLACRYAVRTAWLAPLLVGACSPMLFYGVDLWEHTLAALLATAAVLWFVPGATDFAPWRLAAAGVALGAAIVVREELCCLALGMLLALAWVARRRRLPAALAVAGSASLVVIPNLLLKQFEFGRPVRLSTQRLIDRVADLPAAAHRSSGAPLLDSAAGLNVPLEAAWLLPLVAMMLVRWWLPRASPTRQRLLLVGLATATALWAIADAAFLVHTWARPNAFVQAFPAALFLLFLPPMERPPSPARAEIRQLLTIAAVCAILLPTLASFALSGRPLGGAQWGPRFLLPLCPLLAVVIVFAIERRAAWAAHVPDAPRLLAATLTVLVLASAAVQVQGIRQLRNAKQQYEQLVRTTEGLESGSLVATNLWWFPTVAAALFFERPMVLLDGHGNASLTELLPRLSERGIDALTLVSGSGELADPNAERLARAGWIETARQRVPIWLDVDFVSYRRAS